MIFAVINSPKQQEELKQAISNAQEVKWYKRLKIIQLSSSGKSVPQLSVEFDLCPLTIRHYIHHYTKGGLEALAPSYGKGGFQKLKLRKEEWEEVLHQSPSQFEKLSTACRNWTQKLLVSYCQEYLSISVTQTTICKCLAKLGLKWNRGKLTVTSPDPLYRVKRARVKELKEKAKQGILSSHDAENANLDAEKKRAD